MSTQNSIDKAMNKFESSERLPVSERSLSQIRKYTPCPISLNNKLATRRPDQDTLSD